MKNWLIKKVLEVIRESYAQLTDARIKFKMEECASGMGHRSNTVAVKDVQIKSSIEECALDMGHTSIPNDATTKDAQIKLDQEDYVSGIKRAKQNFAAARDV